jgi:two-component system sensor histidine kinase/response regulator
MAEKEEKLATLAHQLEQNLSEARDLTESLMPYFSGDEKNIMKAIFDAINVYDFDDAQEHLQALLVRMKD